MFQVILGIAIGYFFKPQIDDLINKIKNRSKKKDEWEE